MSATSEVRFGIGTAPQQVSYDDIQRVWLEADALPQIGHGAFGNPKPVQSPYPPIMIGGRSKQTLRVVAQHADLWNIAGTDLDDAVVRSALLDRYCIDIGRDPGAVTRSLHVPVSYDEPAPTRDGIVRAVDAGFTHFVLGLSSPFPDGVSQWVVDELIAPTGL